MFNEKVPLQGSQVRLHNYRKPGHQHSSPNTHGIHQETNTSGDERPRKQTMIYHPFSILLFSSRLCRFSLIINMKSKLTLFTVLINCVSWCKKKSVYNLSSKCSCLRLCNNFSFVDNTLHFTALAVLMSTSILNG